MSCGSGSGLALLSRSSSDQWPLARVLLSGNDANIDFTLLPAEPVEEVRDDGEEEGNTELGAMLAAGVGATSDTEARGEEGVEGVEASEVRVHSMTRY